MADKVRPKWIERAWERYRRYVVPADAGEVQVNETRQAFMAGAAILFTALIHGVSEGDDVQESDERLMADLQAEVDAFGQQLDVKAFGAGKPS